jgi:hypothetical protein
VSRLVCLSVGLYARDGRGALLQVQDVTPGPDLYEEEIEQLAWDNLELSPGTALRTPRCRFLTTVNGNTARIRC